MSAQFCQRCPVRRHRASCPAHWDGCADACELVDSQGPTFRHEVVAARDPVAFRARVGQLAGEGRVTGAKVRRAAAPAGGEVEALKITALCPHARLCNCKSRGNLDCQPGGKHPGEQRTPAQCRECLGLPAPIRAGILMPGAGLGGADVWTLNLLDYVDRKRVEWVGVGLLGSGRDYPWMRAQIEARTTVGRGDSYAARLYRECDVVISWGVHAVRQQVPPRPRRARVVLVSHSHGPACSWTESVFAKSDEADVLVGVSRSSLEPLTPQARARAAIVPNCYDPARVAPDGSRDALRAAWGVRPGETAAGYLGRLSGEKNCDVMIDAVAACPTLRGVFVGNGSEEARLRALAATRGVSDRVVFAGPVVRPGPALSAFDAFVLPSPGESCAIAILEAWAAGVPVVSTPVGVAEEYPALVRGLPLSPTGEQIAAAVQADLADGAGTRARVDKARQLAEAEFGPAKFGAAWTELITRAAHS